MGMCLDLSFFPSHFNHSHSFFIIPFLGKTDVKKVSGELFTQGLHDYVNTLSIPHAKRKIILELLKEEDITTVQAFSEIESREQLESLIPKQHNGVLADHRSNQRSMACQKHAERIIK